MSPDDPIRMLRNLAPRSEAWLIAVGIRCRADLEQVGAVIAYKLVEEHGFAPILLYALEGALRDVHWNRLPPEVRSRLRREVEVICHFRSLATSGKIC